MNKTVTVEGLELTAKADGTYLIVGPENTAAGLQAENRKAYRFDPVESLRVYPSAHTDSVTNTSTCVVGNWYFKYADAPTASTATESARSIDSAKFETDYVLHKTIYVTLAEGSVAASNLKCTGVTFTAAGDKTGASATHAAVRVLVTSSSAIDEASPSSAMSQTVLSSTVTDQTAIPLDIWIYYDGNDSSVYTNNAANLDGASINLTFDVDYSTP